ncbi:MAG: hypothetical protein AB9872_04820 [Solidesulfovibrio sp.]
MFHDIPDSDADRNVLNPCKDQLMPRLAQGGIVAAGNVISHAREIPGVVERIRDDARLDAVVAPIGSGVLVGRRVAKI